MSAEPHVAYLLKGWPRLSELFIASEIWRLEQLGMKIDLFVLKPRDEEIGHPIVEQVRSVPDYLPATTALSTSGLPVWLRVNLGSFMPALRHNLRRHPIGLFRAGSAALVQAVRARSGWRPKRIYAKEFLQAAELVRRLDARPHLRHVHAHFAHGTTTVAWLASMIGGQTFSFTGHAKDIYQQTLNPAGLLARKMRAASFVVTCTGANHEHLDGIECDARVHTVQHGLNAEFSRLLAGPPPSRTAPERFRIISVGRLVRKKGFDLLIEATATLDRSGLDVETIIIGESGDAEDDLHKRIAELGIGHLVTVRGPMSQAELLEEYRRASVFALACRVLDDGDRDGIPNVLVEALAAGLPAVSTNVSGIPELIVNGHTGLLVDEENAAQLASALRLLADDPAMASRLADAGRTRVRDEFDGDRLARRMMALFADTAKAEA